MACTCATPRLSHRIRTTTGRVAFLGFAWGFGLAISRSTALGRAGRHRRAAGGRWGGPATGPGSGGAQVCCRYGVVLVCRAHREVAQQVGRRQRGVRDVYRGRPGPGLFGEACSVHDSRRATLDSAYAVEHREGGARGPRPTERRKAEDAHAARKPAGPLWIHFDGERPSPTRSVARCAR
jgi:hypothetical protein